MIHYYNGKKDERECVDILGGTLVHAVMVNDDYSLDRVLIDDYDYQDGRVGNAKIDASDETCAKVRAKLMLGEMPYNAPERYKGVRAGDIVEVVKGRKYPIGMTITVKEYTNYRTPFYDVIPYIVGTDGEFIQAKNCKVIAVAETSSSSPSPPKEM